VEWSSLGGEVRLRVALIGIGTHLLVVARRSDLSLPVLRDSVGMIFVAVGAFLIGAAWKPWYELLGSGSSWLMRVARGDSKAMDTSRKEIEGSVRVEMV
jgi:hypothetical protein